MALIASKKIGVVHFVGALGSEICSLDFVIFYGFN